MLGYSLLICVLQHQMVYDNFFSLLFIFVKFLVSFIFQSCLSFFHFLGGLRFHCCLLCCSFVLNRFSWSLPDSLSLTFWLKTNSANCFVCHNSMKVASTAPFAVICSTELALEKHIIFTAAPSAHRVSQDK